MALTFEGTNNAIRRFLEAYPSTFKQASKFIILAEKNSGLLLAYYLGGRMIIKIIVLYWTLIHSVAFSFEYESIKNLCVSCHASEVSKSFPSVPNIKWQNRQYLVSELTKFKNGERRDKTMSKVARILSSEDIERLAEDFYLMEDGRYEH